MIAGRQILISLRKSIPIHRVENEIQPIRMNKFELQIYFHVHNVEEKENAKVLSF